MADIIIFDSGNLRKEQVRRVSEQAGLTMAELMRRMMDRCLQEEMINELCPRVSGQISVNEVQR